MPVIFVLFRSSTEKTFLLIAKLWSGAKYRGRSKTKSTSGASGILPGPYQELDNNNLPEVPAAEVTGLRSFLRKIGRTNPVANHEGHSAVMLTDVSEVSDYHDHLRNG